MKSYVKVNLYQKIVQHVALVVIKVTIYPVLNTEYFYVLNLKNLGNNSFNLLMKFILIFLQLFMRNL